MPLSLTINGQVRIFADLAAPASMADVIAQMNLKADQVAVEHNGEIAPRKLWAEIAVAAGDRLEVVHFVGGGALRKQADSIAKEKEGSANLSKSVSEPDQLTYSLRMRLRNAGPDAEFLKTMSTRLHLVAQ